MSTGQQTLERPFPRGPGHGPARAPGSAGRAAAREALRAQIAKLERDLAETLCTCFEHASSDLAAGIAEAAHPARGGPRLLTLGELERERDDLARRVVQARRRLAERSAEHEVNRLRLERMLLEPARHRFERVSNRELGLGGCGVWRVRPRLGLLGMLAGWWEVKLSSGCP